MKSIVLLGSALVVAIAAVACGGDRNKSSTSSAATSALAATTAPTVALTPAFAVLASSALAGGAGGSSRARINGIVASVTGSEVKTAGRHELHACAQRPGHQARRDQAIRPPA